MTILKENQKRFLRGLGHKLSPIVMVGNNGVTEAVVKELVGALAFHELIKVRVTAERDERDIMIANLCEQSGATLVQRVGNIALLFLRNDQKPKIALPRAR